MNNPNMQGNTDLINPGIDPAAARQVSATAAITAPLPTTVAPEIRYYYCGVSAASMHRKDGKKLPFVRGILETNLVYDIQYLEEEIKAGNTYVRHASEEEIHQHQMIKNPRQTMKDELRPEIESELRDKLTKEIMDKLAGDKIAGDRIGGVDGAITATPGATIEGAGFRAAIVGSGAVKDAAAGGVTTTAAKVGSTAAILAGLAKK